MSNDENLKYFAVTAKCGHVGKRYYIEISFPIVALTRKEAVDKVKRFPRVKKDHLDVIKNVKRITYEEYLILLEMNKNDPYLKAKNKQEQDLIDLSDRLIEENFYQDKDYTFKKHNKRLSKKSKRLKNHYFNGIQNAVTNNEEVIFRW